MSSPSVNVMSAKRCRVRFDFWLDLAKSEEKQLADWLQSLKKKRKFLPTLRAALRLYFDLNMGKTDVLYELFPHLRHVPLSTPQAAPKPLQFASKSLPEPPGESDEDLLGEIKEAAPEGNPTMNFLTQFSALVS